MGSYQIEITLKAGQDLKKIKRSGKTSELAKIQRILKELEENPRVGTGHPEKLKYQDGEIWSRKINKKDRMLYEIIDRKVLVLVYCFIGHYGDR